MQVIEKRISAVMMELEIQVPADTVKIELDKAYLNLAKKAHVRGFRPGKAPRNVLTRLYGPQVLGEVANTLVNSTLPQALTEKNMTPVSTPAVDVGKVEGTIPLVYKARVEVTPEIAEVKFEGFELTRPPSAVTDTMVDEEIEGLRQRHAALKTPEPERGAKKSDVVTIDFTLTVEGAEIKDGGGSGVQIELGAGQALPEFDPALEGKKVGDKVNVAATFPDTHPREDLRGKKSNFAVTLTDIKEKVLPALDDEFAKDVGSFQTTIELRADVHTKLEKALKDRAEMALAEQIVQKLNDNNPLDVPPSLVEQQCKVMEQEVVMQARRMGQRITKEAAAGLHDRLHGEAEKKVRAGLLMAAIARKLEMKVTEDDIEKGMAELAAETGKNVAKLRVEYRDRQKRDMLIGMILEDKILDFLESKSKITDEKEGDKKADKDADKKPEKKADKEGDKKAEKKADKEGDKKADKDADKKPEKKADKAAEKK